MQKAIFVHVFVWCLFVTLVFGVLALSRGPVTATNNETVPALEYRIAESQPVPDVAGYLVQDAETGEILLGHESDMVRPTASVIKLLVASAALTSSLLDATTTITVSDVAAPEDFGKLEVGEVYTLRELLFPYLIESSNDAGVAIERTWGETLTPIIRGIITTAGVDGQAMVADFNGLEAETAASPEALATLLKHLEVTTPTVFDITSLSQYVGLHPLVNNSPFIADEHYRGGKHGYTPEAGKTAVLRLTHSFGDHERPLLLVIQGSNNLPETKRQLLEQLDTAVELVSATSEVNK